MTRTPVAQNMGTLYAAYILSSLPLLLLFIAATKPFIQGITSGAFKA
jgi:ABC-type glycerol-3-phosphate transport system permease component